MRSVFLSSLLLALAGSASANGHADAFSLKVVAPEPRIVGGALRRDVIAKRYALNARLVQRSARLGRPSTKLNLDRLFDRIDAREPKAAYFRNEHGHWVARQQNGWTVDRVKTKEHLLRAAQEGKHEAQIVLHVTEPRRSVRDFARRGILYHVSSGTSSFAGSSASRQRNIVVGAKKLEERYVERGEEFDFNAYIGKITKQNGFVEGYVISGDTLNKEDGGGICQVSATLFRAAYEGGFPITERHAHSHRVKYYDPVGYEATVYAPNKNFKFKNDTSAPLFVQASWDRAAGTLRFDLFGAKRKREVRVSAPVVTNFKPAAAPTYVADKSVPKGSRRRLDVPMQGMRAVITRRVRVNGKTKTDRTVSVYRPWGAVYAVHPGDARLKRQSEQ